MLTQSLLETGYIVIRFHHKADWHEIFRRHPDIFGSASNTQFEEQELAVITLRFVKPDSSAFTASETEKCRDEGNAAIMVLVGAISLPPGTRLNIRFAGDGSSSYWYEIVLMAVGLVAGVPYVLHQVGDALEAGGELTSRVASKMNATGRWLKGVAWRLTPKNPNDGDPRRPGCFGQKEQLDRRYKRCRDCGFLEECSQIGSSS